MYIASHDLNPNVFVDVIAILQIYFLKIDIFTEQLSLFKYQ